MQNFIAGRWTGSDRSFAVRDKYTGAVIGEVAQATTKQITEAVAAAAAALDKAGPTPTERATILRRARDLLEKQRELYTEVLVAETGFTPADAAAEIDRALVTLDLSAEEATRLVGDMVPFGVSPGPANCSGFTVRVPLGVVCAITPFNSPLNTVLHKVAPAFAAGNAVILKPSAQTPLTSRSAVPDPARGRTPARPADSRAGRRETVGELC